MIQSGSIASQILVSGDQPTSCESSRTKNVITSTVQLFISTSVLEDAELFGGVGL